MKEYQLQEVFGSSRGIPLNYTNRDSIDDTFKESLRRNQHIAVFGSSKQGKTCLRKRHLHDHEYISIQCSNKQKIEDLNEQILKQVGYQITISEKKGNNGKIKTTLSLSAKFLSFFEGKAEAGYENETTKNIEVKNLEIDLSDVNDIITALKSISFSKFILLEDFHYLSKETQADFALALKSYFDNSDFLFIIIGVWLEENRLISLNGDLEGRVISINADKWAEDDLKNVIENGSSLLNIRFDSKLTDKIIEESYDNVYFVQEVCYRVCKEFKISKTLPTETRTRSSKEDYEELEVDFIDDGEINDGRHLIPDAFNVRNIINSIVENHSGRYNAFITHFDIGHDIDELEIHKWILFAILKSESDSLIKGIKISAIKEIVLAKHPLKEKLKLSILQKTLQKLTDFQVQKQIVPNIIDYSEINQTLQIVDRGFIIWLEHQNKKELILEIGLPTD